MASGVEIKVLSILCCESDEGSFIKVVVLDSTVSCAPGTSALVLDVVLHSRIPSVPPTLSLHSPFCFFPNKCLTFSIYSLIL